MHAPGPTVRIALLALVSGCVIPPSLSVEGDGGPGNSPPAILSFSTDNQQLAPPGPAVFTVNQPSTGIVSLIDTDINDTLTVRMFVNYGEPDQGPALVQCVAPASGTATRTATCDLVSLCQPSFVNRANDLTIVVFDRPLEDVGTPPYQDMQSGGLSATMFFHLSCFN